MQKIGIRDIRVKGPIGVFPEEKILGNEFSVDLNLYTDFSEALQNDILEGTIDYSEVANLVCGCFKEEANLIEHIAGRILDTLEGFDPRISKADVTVKKLSVPVKSIQGHVFVEVTREYSR